MRKTHQQVLDKFQFFDGDMAATYYIKDIKMSHCQDGFEISIHMESEEINLSMTVYVLIEPSLSKIVPFLSNHYRVELFGKNATKVKISDYATSIIIKKVRPAALSVSKLLFEAGGL